MAVAQQLNGVCEVPPGVPALSWGEQKVELRFPTEAKRSLWTFGPLATRTVVTVAICKDEKTAGQPMIVSR